MTDMSDRRIIDTDEAPEPVGAYPHAREACGLLFLSSVEASLAILRETATQCKQSSNGGTRYSCRALATSAKPPSRLGGPGHRLIARSHHNWSGADTRRRRAV